MKSLFELNLILSSVKRCKANFPFENILGKSDEQLLRKINFISTNKSKGNRLNIFISTYLRFLSPCPQCKAPNSICGF